MNKQAAVDLMEGRIARFEETRRRGVPLMFIDSILPGHTRINYAIVGDTASENPHSAPMIEQPHRFQIGMFQAVPRSGPAYHTHDYVEVFVPLTGRWRFYYGHQPERPDSPDGEVELGPWDVISFPPRLWRGFENVSETNAFALAVLDPHDAFRFKDPYWPEWVVEAAAERGLRADENGKMTLPENLHELGRAVFERIEQTASTQ